MQFNTSDSQLRQFCSFLKMPITQSFIEVLASKAYLAVHASPETVSMYITPPETPSSVLASSPLPPIYSFIRDLIVGSRVQAATLFGTMVYMERLKPRLSQAFCSAPDAAYRTLMSCLILSGKYLNDAAPKNKHWSTYCRIYQVLELNSMENYSLSLLDFDLSVSCQEVLYQYNAFFPSATFCGPTAILILL
ncbi:PHO85 cyclin-1 [Entomophthora muscae]|uniref:PHO85 cyclin-1 n=1 Tax=Entomophthora muscae TaxID=34485 RepID=A0ACC2RHN3_9FUNG|nr:PHO85 cyclin-1 [Entomophthora muscae]